MSALNFTKTSPEQLRALARPTPEYAQVAKISHPVPSVDWADTDTTLAKLRHMTSGVTFVGLHDEDVHEESIDCPTRDGKFLELRVHRRTAWPTASSERSSTTRGHAAGKSSHSGGPPLIILFHGGHHVLGFPGFLSNMAGAIAKRLNAVVVSVTYRLAPEHPFPTGVDDAWDAVRWCASHAHSHLGAEPTAGFVVGGVSSGGSLAAVVAHRARDERLDPPLTGLYLACAGLRAPVPANNLPPEYASRLLSRSQPECVDNPVLPAAMAAFMERLHAPDLASPLYAPLLWPTAAGSAGYGHAGLPRTYLQVCGMDVSRDENLAFHDMLLREHVPARLDLYPGLPHAFWVTVPGLAQTERWKEDTVTRFQWLLQY